MPTFDQLDLIVRDVPAAAAFFRDAIGFALQVDEPRFAQLDAGAVTLMLRPDALVPTTPAAGVILHVRVDDLAAAVARAQAHGAAVLRAPAPTDWGTESAMVAGPDGIIVDLYRPS